MANDPMTIDAITEETIVAGLKLCHGQCSGPADYDATNGSAMDLSSYCSEIIGGVHFSGGVTAKADALITANYVNTDLTAEASGVVYFSWSGTAAAVLDNVTDTTALNGYQWHFHFFCREVAA